MVYERGSQKVLVDGRILGIGRSRVTQKARKGISWRKDGRILDIARLERSPGKGGEGSLGVSRLRNPRY